ncbi:plasmid partitioning protein RepB C-terminal domain-containing protein [Aestuariivirga sp.]|uniref:plasmid partitioning protein RepB C-terminal domain-containing protein n=1 Tax=Aestuariivirga sp. TaxID=2650926 RepID=UPI0039E3BFB0
MMTEEQKRRDRVKLSFERESVTLPLTQIVPLKMQRPGTKESKKYSQILGSVRAIGLVEAPVVTPDKKNAGRYFLLDGHLRIEALKDLEVQTVECLISIDDEAYTYNKRINRLSAVQEHLMIKKAMERGVPEERIAEALGMEVTSIRRRHRMLNGICPDAAEILKDTECPLSVFDILRQMAPFRQIEAAELMTGQNNFTGIFAKALLAATPEKHLIESRKEKVDPKNSVTSEHIARMERELASLQTQVKSFEETYGIDNLHLTVARGYIRKLIANNRVLRWLSQNWQEYLIEFQSIAEFETLGANKIAAE